MEDAITSCREKMFKYIFHALCGVATLGFTIFCVHQYALDEDVARIEFQEFNSNEDNIYPSVTICFPNPLLEHKLAQYGEGINVSSYTNFLVGELWDERMASIDYDDVSVDIENYLLGFDMFETTSWKAYHYRHDNKISKSERDKIKSNETGWPPNFYISERGLFGKCWSVDIPYIPGKTIHSFGVIFRSDIFPNGIRPQNYGFGIILHYPHQLSRADFGTYEWKSQAKEAPVQYTMRFKIENTLVLKRRNKGKLPCNKDWKRDDDRIYTKIFNHASCKPSYWKSSDFTHLKNCTTKQQMKNIFNAAVNIKTSPDYPPPCQQIEKIIYFFDEFSWLVDNWISQTEENEAKGSHNQTNEKMFEVLLNFLDGTYMEIQHAKAYDGWSLVGNAGGYIGLFLGYSLLHAFLILPKILKKVYQVFVHAICPKRFPLTTKHRQNGAAIIETIPNRGSHPIQYENSDTPRFRLQALDKHSNCIRVNNHEALEDSFSSEIINDLICDNMTLKSELEKIIVETENLNRKYEEIDTRLKSMNDMCDIVLVDIVKDGKNNKTSQTKDGKQPRKHLLCP